MKKILSLAIICSSSMAIQADTTIKNGNEISPARGIEHPWHRDQDRPIEHPAKGYRSFDGSGNNLKEPQMGAAFEQLLRWAKPDYGDDVSELAGSHRASARAISNSVAAQSQDTPNRLGASDFLWQWGQFIDHDIDLTDGADPAEPANILIPDDDASFIAGNEIPLNRSIYDASTGVTTPRQQTNEISAWIDASNIYGSDTERADALRLQDGSGRLRTSDGNLLPFNYDGLSNAGGDSSSLFLAGDVRANEQIGLTVMHTLFVREHNRLVDELASQFPDWDGEKLYQEARRRVAGIIQAITFNEFLPALLGSNRPAPYSGYKPRIKAGIANIFSAASYRFGHSALSSSLLRLNADGSEHNDGNLPLRNAFFSPQLLSDEEDLDPILRGLARQICQTIDTRVVDDVRNFLFGDPNAGGFDLASLNIQRGRDHGLPSYNETRIAAGLPAMNSFSQITSNPELVRKLSTVYDSPDDIDLWVGGLAEDTLLGAHLGITFTIIIRKQFSVLRDADRFWYQRTFKGRELTKIHRTRLSDIIKRNTSIEDELQRNVFQASSVASQNPRSQR